MKTEKLTMVVSAKVVGEAGDVKCNFTLEYFNLDYGNVVMIEQKLVDLTQSLVNIGKESVDKKI